jgi:hypothetical protein
VFHTDKKGRPGRFRSRQAVLVGKERGIVKAGI